MKVEKRLYACRMKYGEAATELELAELRRWFPDAAFFERDHWLNNYETREKTDEEKQTYADQKYAEYVSQAKRQVNYDQKTRILDLSLVDPMLYRFFNVENEVVASVEVAPPEEGILDIIRRFESATERAVHTVNTMNKTCNVHIGGSLLMSVNSVLLCEDYCTDALQRQLNAGWRILAVCVQPDGRRPDYVLGRYVPYDVQKDLEPPVQAERGKA